MQEIKEDLKTIKHDLTEIKVNVARNTVSLEHHISRTDTLQNIVIALIICVVGACLKAIL